MAEKPSSPASDLAMVVSCSICLENFQDARALPCLHSYCKKCLEGLVTPQGKITCPHCRKEFDVPDGDVSNLNPNFIVNDVVDALTSTGDLAPTPDVQVAPTAARNETTGASCCVEHPEKEYELFCRDCSKLICFKCISNWGTCGQHSYDSIEAVAKEYRRNVEDFLQKKEAYLPSAIKHVEVLTRMKVQQSENVADVTKQISDTFAKYFESLKKREEALIKQAMDMHIKNNTNLSCEVDRVQLEQAKIQNTIDYCHTIIDRDPAVFLQEYGQVKDKVFQGDSQDLVSNIDVAALHFQVTDSLLTDVISNFGNVVAHEEDHAPEEKPMGLRRVSSQPARLPTFDRPVNKLRPANEPGPSNEQGTSNKPGPSYEPFPTEGPRYFVQRPNSDPGAGTSAKPVTWKLHNKNLPNPHVTFEDNGFSVKTVSPKNVAIIGQPGFQRGKHSWKIMVTGFFNGLSIGICVGQVGPGIVIAYDKRMANTVLTVELDCDARKVSVLQDYKAPHKFGFENPHNCEVHPYFCLPPSNTYSINKITVISIDGVTPENNEACCIL